MKKHTGEKPHVCPYPICAKSFPEASTLKRHLRIHTGEKPFRCSFPGCDKAFADATNVKRHEMTHTGQSGTHAEERNGDGTRSKACGFQERLPLILIPCLIRLSFHSFFCCLVRLCL